MMLIFNFDYDTFVNKLGLSKELNFLDQFFKDDQIENQSTKHFVKNEQPTQMKMSKFI